jgi:hypothetical protein
MNVKSKQPNEKLRKSGRVTRGNSLVSRANLIFESLLVDFLPSSTGITHQRIIACIYLGTVPVVARTNYENTYWLPLPCLLTRVTTGF